MVGFVILAVIAPLPWSMIVRVAEQGNPRWMSLLYPVLLNGMSLLGLLTLDVWKSEREPELPWWS